MVTSSTQGRTAMKGGVYSEEEEEDDAEECNSPSNLCQSTSGEELCSTE